MKRAYFAMVYFFSSAVSFADWEATLQRGLKADIVVSVIDQFGNAVPNATINNKFIIYGKNTPEETKLTSETGVAEFKGRVNIEAVLNVSKDGYYRSRSRHKFMNRPLNELISCAQDGKWHPSPDRFVVTLNKKVEEAPVVARNRFITIKCGETCVFPLETTPLAPPFLNNDHAIRHPRRYVQPDRTRREEWLYSITTNIVANASSFKRNFANVLMVCATFPDIGPDWRDVLKRFNAERRKQGVWHGGAYKFSLIVAEEHAGLLLAEKSHPGKDTFSEYPFPIVAPEDGYCNRLDFTIGERGVGLEASLVGADQCILLKFPDLGGARFRYIIINYLAFTRDDDGNGIIKMQYWPMPPRDDRNIEFLPFDPYMFVVGKKTKDEFLPTTINIPLPQPPESDRMEGAQDKVKMQE